jgi:hypothetical protein
MVPSAPDVTTGAHSRVKSIERICVPAFHAATAAGNTLPSWLGSDMRVFGDRGNYPGRLQFCVGFSLFLKAWASR